MFRKYFWLLMIAVFLPGWAFAQEVVEPVFSQPPDWLVLMGQFVKQIPYVGPFLTVAFEWLGVIAAVSTALSAAAQAILAVPELAARWAGATALAAKIKGWSDKILPWLKYFSVFNVQKKKV